MAERTIEEKRRDANLYAGIGVRRRRATKVVDTETRDGVDLLKSPIKAAEESESNPAQQEHRKMTLSLKGNSKNGKYAIYVGAASPIRVALANFAERQAPATLVVVGEGGADLVAAKQPKPKLSAEERKALRASQPKPTEAERIAKAEERLAKRKAKLQQATQNEASL
jgi:hypothetical protein